MTFGKPKAVTFNLVYHDCVIEPWMMEKLNDTDDYMLYALLNGGEAYPGRGRYASAADLSERETEKAYV